MHFSNCKNVIFSVSLISAVVANALCLAQEPAGQSEVLLLPPPATARAADPKSASESLNAVTEANKAAPAEVTAAAAAQSAVQAAGSNLNSSDTKTAPAVTEKPSAAENVKTEAAQPSEPNPQTQAQIDKLIREAEIYLYGDQVPVDLKRAAELYGKAAELGSPKAMMRLSTLYRKGTGVERSEEKAFNLIRTAAEKDYVPAMAALGFCYQDGQGVAKDPALADLWLEKAAEKGHALARVMTSEKYLAKTEDPAAQANGKRLVDTLLQYGSPRELYTISYSYGHGLRLPKDPEKAIFWAKAAADKGGVNAMFYLGECYWNKQDFPAALTWFEKAAEKGLSAAELQTGRIYRDGAVGVQADPAKALYWLKKSAPLCGADDLISIIKLSLTGPKAIRSKAEAQKYLELYIKRAEAKDIQTEADRFWNGEGVRKNFDLGGALSLAALQKGDRSEVCEFAMHLAQPNWIHRDPVTAYAILNQCVLAKNAPEAVKQAFQTLEDHMTPEEIQKAQEMDSEEALNLYLNTHKPRVE